MVAMLGVSSAYTTIKSLRSVVSPTSLRLSVPNDDISAPDLAYLRKEKLSHYVLVPMFKSVATALHLASDPHPLEDDYVSNNKFTWPPRTNIGTHFTVVADDPVVSTALPNAIVATFGSEPPAGEINAITSNLGQLEQNLDLEPVAQAMKLLQLNGFRSFHQSLGSAAGGGAITSDLDAAFLTSIGGVSSLLNKFGFDLQPLYSLSVDRKRTAAIVSLAQMTALGQYLLDNPSDQSVYLKKRPAASPPSPSAPDQSTKKTKTKAGQDWSRTILQLILCTTNADSLVYKLGVVCDFVDSGFDDSDLCSSERYHQFRRTVFNSVLSSYDSTVFQKLVIIPTTQAHMSEIYKGSLSTDHPESERRGTISLGCFNPPSRAAMDNWRARKMTRSWISCSSRRRSIGRGSTPRSRALTSSRVCQRSSPSLAITQRKWSSFQPSSCPGIHLFLTNQLYDKVCLRLAERGTLCRHT